VDFCDFEEDMGLETHHEVRLIKVWMLAIRPKTLPAAAAPVIVGTALAYWDAKFDFVPALAALIGALLLQIGSNVANDYYDFKQGVDAGERLGPTRVTQAGLLSPNQVKRGMFLIFGLAILVGIYLVIHAGWPIIVIGIAAVISAIAYTGGPYPLGYHGLGDLFVFVFFGLAATAGSYLVQAKTVSTMTWLMSVAMGLLTVSILVVNNLRDIDGDRVAGKRTLAVRFGRKWARLEYVFCIIGAYLVSIMAWALGWVSAWVLLVGLSIPLAIRWIRSIYTTTGRLLNKTLAGTGQLELLYAILFACGLLIDTMG
jgi:1,4-dihydroxy-2-naphthoate octaprenyltransferase